MRNVLTSRSAIKATIAALLAPALVVAPHTFAIDGEDTPIMTALKAADEDIKVFNDHIVTLASPWMEGRAPGTRGSELAKEYVEFHFKSAGLVPAFDMTEGSADGSDIVTKNATFRQAFPMGSETEVKTEELSIDGGMTFTADQDFVATAYGSSGEVTAPAVFVGYSIQDGPDDYSTYGEDDDLTGKIAIMFRFEPMDDEGNSLWSENRWSRSAQFNRKFREAIDRNAEAIIVINPPEANDPRTNTLPSGNSGGAGMGLDVPVLMMTPAAGDRLIKSIDTKGRSLMDLRQHADSGGGIIHLSSRNKIAINTAIESVPLLAENVAGLLPGRGANKDEIIVIGAHLDHLGMGYFGSRANAAGKLHPGADDNASGSAAIIMIADKMAQTYAQLPDDANLRTVLFMCFDAEESGLNGSRYYVRNPITDIEKHRLMINFDMIGRIENERLSVSGVHLGKDFDQWVQPILDESTLEIVQPSGISGASDHTPFMNAGMPIIFAIIADFHGDYHTPEDVSWKINRVGSVKTVHLFYDVLLAAARREGTIERAERRSSRRENNRESESGVVSERPRGQIKVQFGIVPANYNDDDPGIAVDQVLELTSAYKAGIKSGDRIMTWNGEEIGSIIDWMTMLSKHNPGDKVKVGIIRDGKEMDIDVVLFAREESESGG